MCRTDLLSGRKARRSRSAEKLRLWRDRQSSSPHRPFCKATPSASACHGSASGGGECGLLTSAAALIEHCLASNSRRLSKLGKADEGIYHEATGMLRGTQHRKCGRTSWRIVARNQDSNCLFEQMTHINLHLRCLVPSPQERLFDCRSQTKYLQLAQLRPGGAGCSVQTRPQGPVPVAGGTGGTGRGAWADGPDSPDLVSKYTQIT